MDEEGSGLHLHLRSIQSHPTRPYSTNHQKRLHSGSIRDARQTSPGEQRFIRIQSMPDATEAAVRRGLRRSSNGVPSLPHLVPP